MAHPTPLDDLAQHIAQQEAKLASLRQEYQARQGTLAQLTRRKEELTTKLQEVEAEISSLVGAGKPSAEKPRRKKTRAKATAARKGSVAKPPVTLPNFVLTVLREAQGEVVPLQQLTEAAARRGFTSRSLPQQIKVRVYELVKKGVIQRAPEGAGVFLKDGKVRQGVAARQSVKRPTTVGPKASQPPLTEVLIDVLRKSDKPLGAQELAKRILATGYRTNSKNFANVVWVYLGKINTVEKAPEGGYRLKKGKK